MMNRALWYIRCFSTVSRSTWTTYPESEWCHPGTLEHFAEFKMASKMAAIRIKIIEMTIFSLLFHPKMYFLCPFIRFATQGIWWNEFQLLLVMLNTRWWPTCLPRWLPWLPKHQNNRFFTVFAHRSALLGPWSSLASFKSAVILPRFWQPYWNLLKLLLSKYSTAHSRAQLCLVWCFLNAQCFQCEDSTDDASEYVAQFKTPQRTFGTTKLGLLFCPQQL